MKTYKFEKGIEMQSLTFNANCAVLLKKKVVKKTGEFNFEAVEFERVCKDSRAETIIKAIISGALACYKGETEFAGEFGKVDDLETQIKAKKLLSGFIGAKAYTIYKTNSSGKIDAAYDSEIPLSQTALRIKDSQAITTAKGKILNAIIHTTAKAVQAQMIWVKDVTKREQEINKVLAENAAKAVTETATETVTTDKVEAKKATKKVAKTA